MTMATRAIFKGTIRFSGARLPVSLYSAVADSRVHFRLLHRPDRVPVRQEMVDPKTGKPVAPDEIRRGIEVDDGVFVVVTPEELEQLEAKPSREIEISRFVDDSEIDLEWYDRPYYVGPDGDEGTFRALVEVLARKGRVGVAEWTMRKRQYGGVLRASGEALVLVTLRPPAEVVSTELIQAPAGRDLEPKEVALAEQLVSALEGPFEPREYRDEFSARVRELVEAKARGRRIRARKPPRKRAPRTLEDALRASVRSAGEKKVA
jgi:DNA end-binding protein Ku